MYCKTYLSILIVSLVYVQHAYSAQDDQTENEVIQLAPLHVNAHISVVGEAEYNQQQLKNTSGNKTISDFLKIHPNVQFDNASQAAGTQGELSVQNISINGALYYENKYLLDNTNVGNLLNPAAGDNDNNFNAVSGSSQAVTLNTDLICNLQVLDSNVSAEFGQFTGGVVKASTCAPKTKIGEIHGNVNYDYTSSSWSKYNYVSDDELAEFEENRDDNYQKKFIKQGISASVYGNVTEQLGLSLATSHRWSNIDLLSSLADSRNYNQTRAVDHVDLGVFYQFNEKHDVKLRLSHGEDQAKKYVTNSLNSKSDQSTSNDAIDVEFKHKFDSAIITQSLVYQEKDIHRDTDNTSSVVWLTSSAKNWSNSSTASEGGAGALQNNQKTFEYALKSVFLPLNWGSVEHQFTLGAGYGHDQANWYRPVDFYSYYVPSKNNGILGVSTCTTDEGTVDPYCDLTYSSGTTSGQAHGKRLVHQAGTIDIQQDRAYAFLENQMNWKNILRARLGIRTDYDSLTKNNNFAPRSRFEYLPFADDRLVLTTGWNRYYAQNAFIYALQDGINALAYYETRKNINDDWAYNSAYSTTNISRTQLDTPYADEFLFAVSGRISHLDWQLKYLDRKYEDQIRKLRITTSPLIYNYSNTGRSKSDIYSLTLQNYIPVKIYNSLNSFYFAADYTDTIRNFNDYDDILNSDPTYILYDGKVIENINRPANNYNQPWTLRLGWNTEFQNFPLRINQFLRYKGSYDAMVKSTIPVANRFVYNGETVSTQYTATRMKPYFSWDVKFNYDLNLTSKLKPTLGLTINNLTNHKNQYINTSSEIRSASGRQFIAEVNFKF
ncbi:TonB-dependent receptor [Acinetobacter qingfengensis]|nr:TonB-dependent receptor plug domain-containing protein [Acinetobacter qingfengensis]KAA8735682.1 TonB-dependent receptor [Acinetobacter qingfengensis]